MPETPRPMVDVLRLHAVTAHRLRMEVLGTECGCDQVWRPLREHAQHQSDMLAAEGYPVTADGLAERDRQVLRTAAADVRVHRDIMALFSAEAARGIGRAAEVLDEHAERGTLPEMEADRG